jgi:hypothetical protein
MSLALPGLWLSPEMGLLWAVGSAAVLEHGKQPSKPSLPPHR